MADEKRCMQCGAVLAADAPQGLCPACLLKRGLESGSAPGESAPPPTPADLARYFPELEILELIGRGGMGAVYKARQKQLDRLVALKVLPASVKRDPAFAERFAREAKALARLTHPNIVAVYDSGQKDGLFYFVMEFVDGMNLRQLLSTGKIAPKEALAIVPQICDALQYAHDKGIVHRDIKPENILLDKAGTVKIADFGLAKLVGLEAKDLRITGSGDVMGTPHYMAPEQVEHPQDVDHRADIYSLGVVFYQMLTGELPIGRFAPPSRKVQIDVRLDEVVLRALEKEPEHRYQHASEVKTQVETIITTPASASGRATKKSTMAGVLENIFGITFASPVAVKLVNISALGFLCFLGYVPLPGWQRLFGFSGFFGLIGLGFIVERFRCVVVVGRRGGRAVVNWPGVLLMFAVSLAVAESVVALLSLAIVNRIDPVPVLATFAAVFAVNVAIVSVRLRITPLDRLKPLDGSRLSLPAVIGACLALLPFVTGVATLIGRSLWVTHREYFPLTGPNLFGVLLWLLLLASIPASLGTTILGWVAVGQIRRSAGKLYGLGLALVDALVFPLLALDCGIVYATFVVAGVLLDWPQNYNQPPGPSLVSLVGWIFAIVADVFIILWAWRAAQKPLNGSPAIPPVGGTRHGWLEPLLCVVALVMVVGFAGMAVWTTYRGIPRGSPAGMADQQVLSEFDWAKLAAQGRLLGGELVQVDGRPAVKVENTNSAPLQLTLFKIENPPITSKTYVVSGEIKYENVEGTGYLEMWNYFPPLRPGLPEGQYFSRTLALPSTGPMSQISGTSSWRAFSLPFDRTGMTVAPTRLELNVFLPGRGVVFLGPVKLVQFGSTDEPARTGSSRTFSLRHRPASEMAYDLRQILLGHPGQEAKPATNDLELTVTAPPDALNRVATFIAVQDWPERIIRGPGFYYLRDNVERTARSFFYACSIEDIEGASRMLSPNLLAELRGTNLTEFGFLQGNAVDAELIRQLRGNWEGKEAAVRKVVEAWNKYPLRQLHKRDGIAMGFIPREFVSASFEGAPKDFIELSFIKDTPSDTNHLFVIDTLPPWLPASRENTR